jgi:hypothetical protein
MGLLYLLQNEIQKASALNESQFVCCSCYCDIQLLICYTRPDQREPGLRPFFQYPEHIDGAF